MTETERLINLWDGQFGIDYFERTKSHPWPLRCQFWRDLVRKYNMASIIEVGCGQGFNLACLSYLQVPSLVGIECNRHIRRYFIPSGVAVLPAWAHDIPFKDNMSCLVFTCGVLCHIPDESLPVVLDEMRRCSNKYVLICEYYSRKTETIKDYHGAKNALFKRNYREIYMKAYPDDELVDEGYLDHDKGFDNVTYWMWEVKK